MFGDRPGFDAPFEISGEHVAGRKARLRTLDEVGQVAVADFLHAVDMQVMVDLLHEDRLDPGQLRASDLHPLEHAEQNRPVEHGGGAAKCRRLQDDPRLVHVPQSAIGERTDQPVGPLVFGNEPALMDAPEHIPHHGAADVEVHRHERLAEAEATERHRGLDRALGLGRDACPAAARDLLRMFAGQAHIQSGKRRVSPNGNERRARGCRGHDIAAPLEPLDMAFLMQAPQRHLHRGAADPERLRDGALQQHEPRCQPVLHQMLLQHLMHLFMQPAAQGRPPWFDETRLAARV